MKDDSFCSLSTESMNLTPPLDTTQETHRLKCSAEFGQCLWARRQRPKAKHCGSKIQFLVFVPQELLLDNTPATKRLWIESA